jgi:hypothetical protein
MSNEPFDLMGYVDEELESSSGGGLVLEVKIDGVWMVFHKGHGPDETNWVFNSKEEGVGQKALALEYIDEHGVTDGGGKKARPYVGFRFTQYGDSVLNREEPLNWTDGKISKGYVGFGKAYQEIIKPSIVDIVGLDKQFQFGEKFYAQVGRQQDPDRPTYMHPTTHEEMKNWVPYIAYAFEDRREALEAAESDDTFAFINIPDKPDLYSHDDWDSLSRSIIKIFASDPSIKKSVAVKTYGDESLGITEKIVKRWYKLAKQMREETDEIPF